MSTPMEGIDLHPSDRDPTARGDRVKVHLSASLPRGTGIIGAAVLVRTPGHGHGERESSKAKTGLLSSHGRLSSTLPLVGANAHLAPPAARQAFPRSILGALEHLSVREHGMFQRCPTAVLPRAPAYGGAGVQRRDRWIGVAETLTR